MGSQRITRDKWARYITSFKPADGKKVKSMSVGIQANDFDGSINITDLQVQSGNQVTVQMPNTSEILKYKIYNFDEGSLIHSTFADEANTIPAIKKGSAQPTYYQNMKNRVFNIVGRGHEVLAFPNVFHEDYTQELLTSGLDLTLYPKEDYDWLRISTNDGGFIPNRYYSQAALANHPLNWRYSREIYFDKGLAGDTIQLSCTLVSAMQNDVNYPLNVRAATITDSKQQLMMAPYGSFRLRVEFYKRVWEDIGETDINGNPIITDYVKDTGIGFYGYAEFKQVQQNPNHSF